MIGVNDMCKYKIMIAFRSMAFDCGLSTSQAASALMECSEQDKKLYGNTLNSWCHDEYYIPAWALAAAIKWLENNNWSPASIDEWSVWSKVKNRSCAESGNVFDAIPSYWSEHQKELGKIWLIRSQREG